MRTTLTTELDAIETWATHNHLKLNANKSREMVFSRRSRGVTLPPPLPGLERVDSMVVLGVTMSSDLRASAHVDRILGSCSSSIYALSVLRAHGLQSAALHTVARATTTARLLYAAPAWWGLTTAEDRLRLERFHIKMQRLGFLTPDIISVDPLVRDIEGRLLRAVMRQNTHVLRSTCFHQGFTGHIVCALALTALSFQERTREITFPEYCTEYRHSTMAPTF